MNAPERFLEAAVGAAVVKVPERAAVLAYLEMQLDLERPIRVALEPTVERIGAALEDKFARLPAIGDPWDPDHLQEVYAGLTLHDNKSHALVLLPEECTPCSWKDAVAWAIGTGGVLPSRFDALALFQNLRGHFKKDEAYWTSEQHADDSSFAWSQHFDWGYQGTYRVGRELRARAVRRVGL